MAAAGARNRIKIIGLLELGLSRLKPGMAGGRSEIQSKRQN
tara:strand:+ start:166 stop:288 length:123 start_codon:yes stop_codon:yes gene_type:complete